MPSLLKTFRKVAGKGVLTVERSPTSAFEQPSRASRAICVS
jgi:hypothetical protein